MKTFLIYCTLIFSVFTSCYNSKVENNEVPIINLEFVDNASAYLSDFVESNSVVLLDDSADIIIGEISKIDLLDSVIIITDKQTKQILFFNHNGNLLNVINSIGRGPGEYVMIHSTWVNHQGGEIELYDRDQHKILIYNFQGEFIKEFRSPGFVDEIASTGPFRYYFRSAGGFLDDNMQPTYNHILITTPDTLKIDHHKDFYVPGVFNEAFFSHKNDSSILFLMTHEDRIYEFVQGEINLRYILKFEPDPIWTKDNYRKIKTHEGLDIYFSQSLGKVGNPFFYASEKYLFIRYGKQVKHNMFTNAFAIYSMVDEKVIVSYSTLINDIDGFSISFPKYFNDSLFITVMPQNQLNNEAKEAISKLYNVDFPKSINPILIVSKLKGL